MAPFIPVPNVAQCEVRYTVNSQQVENVLYFDYKTSDFFTCAAAVSEAFRDIVWATLRASYGPQASLTSLYWTDLDSASGPVYTFNDALPQAGTGVIATLPNGTALVISFKTNKRGRSYRGRNYLAGFILSTVAGSLYDAAFVSDVEDVYATFRATTSAAGHDWVVVSRYQNELPLTEGEATPVVTAEVVNRATRSQRRRNPGIGV